jgi:hypothetical protein
MDWILQSFKSIGPSAFIAFGFVSWPVLGSYTKETGGWVGVIVGAATALMIGLCSMSEISRVPLPSKSAIVVLLAAGLLNGFCVALYAAETARPAAGLVITTVSVLMVVWGYFLDSLVNGSPMSVSGVAGVLLAVSGILLMRLQNFT